MVRSSDHSLWFFKLIVCCFLVLALTSCEKGKPDKDDKKKTDPGKIKTVTLVVPASGTSVQLYAKVELLVEFATAPSTTKPYDPDPALGGMDLTAKFTGASGTLTVPGFYDGTGWRIRFAPLALGKHKYTVTYRDSDGTGTWSEGEFDCVTSAYRGFARISGRYLRMTNGSVFFPVGHNNGYQTNVEVPSLTDMAARGENLLAFWHATPWDLTGPRAPIENISMGVGNYNQSALTYLEGLIGRAEAANMFLQPTIWSHGELRQQPHKWSTANGWWELNGYSAICATPQDFFVMSAGGAATEQWRLQKNFLRYLFARYGYSRAILNWVVIAELDGTSAFYRLKAGATPPYDDSDWEADSAQLTAWLQAARDYWNGMDFYRRNASGQSPLVAFPTDWEGVTVALSLYTAGYDAAMGLRGTDTYTRGRGDDLMAAVGGAETTALYQGSAQPCFHAEIGGDELPIAQPQVAHDGLWSCISAGACMAPLQWCDNGTWVLLTNPTSGAAIRDQLQCVSTFMGGISYLGETDITSSSVTTEPPLWVTAGGWATHTATQGFAWVRTNGPIGTPFNCTIPDMTDGVYSVQWYNVISNSPVAVGAPAGATCVAGILTVVYPTTVTTSLVCRFQRTGDLGGPPPDIPGPEVSERAMRPPVEGGLTVEPEGEPEVVPPSGPAGEEDPPGDSDEPVPPPTEF